ncbi:MAG: hypothetical protein Tsb005_10800 [Gammaproteobacteria bacterium]
MSKQFRLIIALIAALNLTPLSLAQTANANDVTAPTSGTGNDPSTGLPGLPGGSTQLLTEIRDLVTGISNLLGLGGADKIPATPPTPDVTRTKLLPQGVNHNLQGTTVSNFFSIPNKAIDQPVPATNNDADKPTFTQQAIYNTLTTTRTSQGNGPSANSIRTFMASLGITREVISTTFNLFNPNDPSSAQSIQANNSLNLNSLLGPLAYQPGTPDNPLSLEQRYALYFIRFLTGQADPIEVPTAAELENAGTSARNKFLVALRAYTAHQSVGASNLYQMFARRVTVPNLGLLSGLRDANGNPVINASPLEVERHMATRRILTPQWFDDMEKASPITIQRETLYTLAEIEYLMNQQRDINERMLATLTALQLESLEQNRTGLDQLRQQVTTR